VTLYEYQSGDDLIGPGGSSQYSMAAFQERPARFATSERVLSGDCESPRSGPSSSLPVTGSFAQTDPTTTAPPATTVTSEASAPTTLAGPVTNNHFREIAFSESGRLFLARIVSVSDPTEELLDEGLAVLDSLVVEAVDKPPEQAAPDEAAAEQAIVDAINAANGTPSPVPLAISVEGGHPFANPEDASAAAEHAANADDTTRSAYEASKDGKIVARINWIEFDSETRARLNFDLLVDGQQITVTTTGYAVLEDGNWRLGRETFCEIFSRGGVQCPA
jgi:hypothetical protein